MFGLIPMVITIILAGLITAAVAYLGGDIFTDSSVRAQANTFINEGSQVRSAAQVYRATEAEWPQNHTADLTADGKYLGSEPTYDYTIDGASGIVTSTDSDITEDICIKIQEAAGDETDDVGYTLPTAVADINDQLFGCFDDSGALTFQHR